jgi:AsmA protein
MSASDVVEAEMNLLKPVAWLLGSLLVLVLVGVLTLTLLFDPNDYKPDLEKAVADATSRTLSLEGDLALDVFPWIAIEFGPARLSDAAGFGDEPFLAVERARLSVKLMPLLGGRVEIGDVLLDRPRLKLATDASGRNNWDDLGKKEPAPAGAPEAPEAPAAEGARFVPTVASLAVNDAEVSFTDLKAQSTIALRDVNVATGQFASGEPVDAAIAFAFEHDEDLRAETEIEGRLMADFDAQTFSWQAPRIDVNVTGAGYPAGGVPIALAGRAMTLDLANETLDISDLDLDLAGARVTGALQGRRIVAAPEFSGAIALDEVSPREWLPRLGVAVPETTDPNALSRVRFEGKLAATASSFTLNDVVVGLDDTTARGSLGVADFETTAIRMNLDVDRIDADRYLAPEEKSADAAAAEAATEIPVDTLRDLDVEGRLRIGEAVFTGIRLTKVDLGVKARKGRVHVQPLDTGLYDGRYQGTLTLDVAGASPRLTLDGRLGGIDLARVAREQFESERVSGRGNVAVKVAGTGADTDAMLRTLSGNVTFDVADGAIEGTDLWYEVRRARALFKREAAPTRSGPERTPFTSLRGTGVLTNGVLKNDDLDASMEYMQAKGAGTVDLVAQKIDYKLTAKVSKVPDDAADAEAKDLSGMTIPIAITGALDDPKIRPDMAGLVKAQAQQAIEKQTGKAQEKIQEKLKGIFGGSRDDQ